MPSKVDKKLKKCMIVHQPTVTTTAYHRYPVGITCPFCHNSGITRVRLESGCLPWLLCGILCFFGWVHITYFIRIKSDRQVKFLLISTFFSLY
ncbi:unnamed protein product [Schistosoma mattheei]|uniref:Uncharacterized protein n=1 Tax=Schistosoma mattheei TaxID=31246 RepID=A0A183NGM8_9TREM|nr:unnamed protein product [Schistosoma mattheei]